MAPADSLDRPLRLRGTALHTDFTDYSEVYADSMNRQLLLNLARLANDEPAYFIQLGTIASQYQFTTSASFSPSHVATTRPNLGRPPASFKPPAPLGALQAEA